MRTRAWPALLLALAVLAAACGEAPAERVAAPTPTEVPAEETTPAAAETATPEPAPEPTPEPVLAVVVTAAPVADLVERVGAGRVTVSTLIPPGADSHTYEPRPRDVALFDDADAFIGVGLGLNAGAVGLAEDHLPDGAPLILLAESSLEPDRLVFDHDHSHDDGHSHDDEDAGPNPHVWMSVRVTMDLVDAIADHLAELDPDGAETYAQAARELLLELRALDEAIADAVDSVPAEHRTLVTYHDAWSYFARDYGLESVTAVQPADFSEPSAADVRAIIDLIRAEDVPAVFGSEVFPSDVLDAIAEETGAVYVSDLADDVLPGAPGDPEHSYVELMRRNAVKIVNALGGDPAPLER